MTKLSCMKKFVFMIITLFAIVVFASASGNIASDSRVGSRAANFTIGNDDNVVTLNQFRGKYVVLSMWSSADAMTRLDNIKHDRMARDNDNMVHLSVNFDRSRALFNEVVSADSLDLSSQFFCEMQDRKQFEQKWGIREQYDTFLISPQGKIVAVNPSDNDLAKVIK